MKTICHISKPHKPISRLNNESISHGNKLLISDQNYKNKRICKLNFKEDL